MRATDLARVVSHSLGLALILRDGSVLVVDRATARLAHDFASKPLAVDAKVVEVHA